MILELIKSRKFIIRTILTIVVMIVIYVSNPFNIIDRIFGGRLELRDTANMVTEIKAIGQLVTAEYYGEVISSLDEDTLRITRRAGINTAGNELYLELKQYLLSRYVNGSMNEQDAQKALRSSDGKKEIRRALGSKMDKWFEGEANLPGNFEDLYYSTLLQVAKYEYGEEVHGISADSKKRKGSYYDRKVHNVVLAEEYRRLSMATDTSYSQLGLTSDVLYSDTYLNYGNFDKPGGGRERLTLIGRGWVKAGFDFEELNEDNLVFDEDQKVIHLYGFKAKILNQDINPWFIPQKKIPGFEVLNYKKADFNDMKLVKINCVQKLGQKAKEANILRDAQANGEEAMEALFSLVMGDAVEQVYFHPEPKEDMDL